MEINEFPEIIKRCERAMNRGTEDRLQATLDMLDALTKFCKTGGLFERGAAQKDVDHWYTRAAATLTKFITDEHTKITLDGL